MAVLVQNKNAYRNYEIIEDFEAGIALVGTEVKSISHSQASINESYINISHGEIFILNMHVAPSFEGNQFNVDPYRTRKLLMHKREIRNLSFASQKQGLTIIPINIYWKTGKIKLKIALCRGKKLHDKREDMKLKDSKKEIKKFY